MTSVQTMLRGLGALALVALATGCSGTEPRLTAPGMHTAPYDTRHGEVIWAVVPLANESGTTAVDPLAVSDALVNAAEEIRGVRCLPVNRTIEAMRALGMERVSNAGEARELARALGAEGVLIGTITAWDPYDPPSLGVSLALFPADEPSSNGVDPRALSRSTTDGTIETGGDRSPVVISEHLDARSHGTQVLVRGYATGRSETNSALGWRVYLASMDLYTEFAAHELMGRLLEEEWLRLARESSRQANGSHD
ncbi:MAG: hypothetical protein ACF8Q5_09190 [Phycisphaerales bacterium JB040]